MTLIRKSIYTGIDLLYISIYMMILISCVPFTMAFPGIFRQSFQIFAMLIFIMGLVLYRKKEYLFQYIIIVLFTTIFVYGVWKNKKTISSCAANVIIGWAFCIFGIILKNENDIKKKKRLLIFITIVMIVTSFTTLIGIYKYPLVVRELGRSEISYTGVSGADFALIKQKYRIANVAGWNQLYGIVFFIPSLVFLFKKTKAKRLIVYFMICSLCVVRAQITFAVLLLMFLVIFSILECSTKRKHLLICLFAFLVGIIVIFNAETIIQLSIKFSEKSGFMMLSVKLTDLLFLIQGVSRGDAAARFALYYQSIRIFKNYPILGASIYGDINQFEFSQHSDFFDLLGYYGLAGLAMITVLSFSYFL